MQVRFSCFGYNYLEILPLILTFSVGALLIKYNSYKDAFISGLKASSLTSMLLFVSTLFYGEVLERIS